MVIPMILTVVVASLSAGIAGLFVFGVYCKRRSDDTQQALSERLSKLRSKLKSREIMRSIQNLNDSLTEYEMKNLSLPDLYAGTIDLDGILHAAIVAILDEEIQGIEKAVKMDLDATEAVDTIKKAIEAKGNCFISLGFVSVLAMILFGFWEALWWGVAVTIAILLGVSFAGILFHLGVAFMDHRTALKEFDRKEREYVYFIPEVGA